MTIDAIEMAAESLQRQFLQQVSDNTFPSVHGLRELAGWATHCREFPSSTRVIVAFILEKMLKASADDIDERPVTTSEADALRDTILEPVKRAIEFLNGKYGDPIEISADLARVSR